MKFIGTTNVFLVGFNSIQAYDGSGSPRILHQYACPSNQAGAVEVPFRAGNVIFLHAKMQRRGSRLVIQFAILRKSLRLGMLYAEQAV